MNKLKVTADVYVDDSISIIRELNILKKRSIFVFGWWNEYATKEVVGYKNVLAARNWKEIWTILKRV